MVFMPPLQGYRSTLGIPSPARGGLSWADLFRPLGARGKSKNSDTQLATFPRGIQKSLSDIV